jgi:hypothetical protein
VCTVSAAVDVFDGHPGSAAIGGREIGEMWLFGQVWFACLVGFVVGVGLTWLWQVRPLNRRVGDLERSARLADRPAQQPSRQPEGFRADDLRPGFGNASYDPAAETAAPSGVGVSTGSGRPGLDEMFEPERRYAEPTQVDATRVHSVDDYVEALVQEYQGDSPARTGGWANRNPEAVESWRPGALGSRLDASEEHDQSDQSDEQDQRGGQSDSQLTSYQPVQHYPEPEAAPTARADEFEATQLHPRPFANTYGMGGEFGGRGNADEQYLDYLRSGAMDNDTAVDGELATAEPEAVRDYVAHEPEPAQDYQAQDYPEYPRQEQYPAEQYGQPYPVEQNHEPATEYAEPAHAEPAEEQAAEVTSVLPFIEDEPAEPAQIDQTQTDQTQTQAEQTHAEPTHAEPTQLEPARFEPGLFEPAQAEAAPAEQHLDEHYSHAQNPNEQTVVDQQPVIEQEEEQGVPAQHNYFEPGEPLTSLVRPHSSGGGLIASAAPFQLDGPDRVDMNAQQGQLTPIAEGGWQPFAKPFDEDQPAETAAREWQDDWADEPAQANGSHAETARPEADDESEQAERTGPIAAEIIEQADHQHVDHQQADHQHADHQHADHQQAPPEAPAETTTVFSPVTDAVLDQYGQDAPTPRHQVVEDHEPAEAAPEPAYPTQDYAEYDEYDEDERPDSASPARSLFEPVIEPEQPTGYLTPVAPPAPQDIEQSPQPSPQQREPQRQPQPTAPHPIRVRTGVAQTNRPVRAPAGSAGWQTGPFGPGSALPLPDGSAPSPQFRVKARTSSMVFHTESSPFYDRLEPQVWFTSQEDAQRAGFTSWERPRTW